MTQTAESAARASWLRLACAFLVGLTVTLLVFVAITAWRAEPALAIRFQGDLTVFVVGRFDGGDLETSDAAAARAGEALLAAPGVDDVTALAPSPADPLIARLAGAPRASPEAGPPRLLAIRLRSAAPAELARVRGSLARADVAGAIDDHHLGSSPMVRAVVLLGIVLLAGLLIAPFVLAALVHFAALRRARAGSVLGPVVSLASAGSLVGVTLVSAVAPHTVAPLAVRLDTSSCVAAVAWLGVTLLIAAAGVWLADQRLARGS